MQIAHHMFARAVDFDPPAAWADEVGQSCVEVEVVSHLIEVGHVLLAPCFTEPLSGANSPRIIFSRVVLPAPLGPIRPTLSPRMMVLLKSWTTVRPRKLFANLVQFGHDLAASVALRHFHAGMAHHVAALERSWRNHVVASRGPLERAAGFHAFANPDFFLRLKFVEAGIGQGFVGQLLGL